MNTTALVHTSQVDDGNDVNDVATVFGFCDVVAVAELLLICATTGTEDDLKPRMVTIADVIETMERQFHAEEYSQAFENAFLGADGSGMSVADRQETVAHACAHLVSSGWLRYGTENKVFASDFWDMPERDIGIRVTPSWGLITLMRKTQR